MPTKQRDDETEPDVIGKPHAGSERVRDEQRYGHGRNDDDDDPSELAKADQAVDDDEELGSDASPQSEASGSMNEAAETSDDGETEQAAQHAGMGRGEKPMKSKARAKGRA